MDALTLAGWLFAATAALIAALYMVVLYELRKSRDKLHRHASFIQRLMFVMPAVCRRLGIDWPENKDDP